MAHHPLHAKPVCHNPLRLLAKRYVKAHKRYHLLFVTGLLLVNTTAIFLTHEYLVHIGLAVGSWSWDTLVTLVEFEE